jgi:uncharacterized protein (DUF2236 family)
MTATTSRREPHEMRKVAREGVLIAGGGAAILLQIANPGVGQGVAEHSDFANRPLDRLRTTMTYVFGVTFGTPEEAEHVSKVVTAVHRKVIGPGYDATDPHLQLWVASTLYDTGVALYERIFGPLDPDTAEIVYQQHSVFGTALQVPASLWPKDRAAFRRYWDDKVATIEVTDEARRVAHDLLHPGKAAPAAIRAGSPLNRLVTAGLLPPRIRDQYGLAWDARRERAFNAFIGMTRATYPHLPTAIREIPKDRYLRDMRRRLGAGQRVMSQPSGAN